MNTIVTEAQLIEAQDRFVGSGKYYREAKTRFETASYSYAEAKSLYLKSRDDFCEIIEKFEQQSGSDCGLNRERKDAVINRFSERALKRLADSL